MLGMRVGVAFALAACGPPPELQAAAEPHLAEARRIAEAAGGRCDELGSVGPGGAFTVARGPHPSPALGSSLLEDPNVLNVEVSCSFRGRPGRTVGTRFDPVRPTPAPRSINSEFWVIGGSTRKRTAEAVRLPSSLSDESEAFDAWVERPLPDGGHATVTVALRRR